MNVVLRKYGIFTKAVAGALIGSMLSMMVTTAYAQVPDMGSIGRQGQAFGKDMITQWKNTKPSQIGNVLTMPGTSEPLSINDLYPGTSAENQKPNSFYFPEGYEQDGAKYESVYNSGSGMDNAGSNAQGILWNDANQANPSSLQGSAYKIILDTANRSRPDMRNDPMFESTREVLSNMDDWREKFGDCTSETKFTEVGMPTHVPDYETCERLFKPKFTDCQLKHDIQTSKKDFEVYVAAGGRDVVTMKFDLRNGTWQTISPTDGDRFTAQIPTVNYNEVCEKTPIAARGITNAIWNWTSHGLGGDLDTSITHHVLQYPSCQNNLQGIVQIRDTESSSSVDFILAARFALSMEFLLADEWTPAECVEAARYIDDNFCSADLDPIIMPPQASEGGECHSVNGVTICKGDAFWNAMKKSPTIQLPKTTLSADMSNFQCNYNIGPMGCWTDANGNQQCPENAGETETTCEKLEADPTCGYVRSECIGKATGQVTGSCYVHTDVYDCGYDVDVTTLRKDQVYQCNGPIRCMGTECIDIGWTDNEDFAKAAALLNAAQFMAQDMDCTEQEYNPEDDNPKLGCYVFPGEHLECKKAVGGIVNCCEKPEGISLADYITVIMAAPKLNNALTYLGTVGADGGVNAFGSAYQALKDPIMQGFDTISKPFTNAIDNISGVFEPISEAIDVVKGAIQDTLQELYLNAFGETAVSGTVNLGTAAGSAVAGGWEQLAQGAADEFAQQAAQEAAQEFAKNVMGAFSIITTIYTIYTVAMLAIKMIYKCTEDELSLNVQRELKNCTYVGSYCATEVLGVCIEKRESYCCYKSPLSRIIQEQARPQLGRSFGDAESPECSGLTIQDVANLDWDRINLDEWLGILQSTGNWKAAGDLDINALTGPGSTFDLGSRVDAEERAINRLEQTDVDSKRIELESEYRPYEKNILP